MKCVSDRIPMITVGANNLEVIKGDIGNSYLNSNIEGNIYIRGGANFEMVGIMAERVLLELVKALYGLPTTTNICHAHLSHTLRAMIFKPTCVDPDVFIRGGEVGYNYIGIHNNDFLVGSFNPTSIFNKLKDTYTLKAFGQPKVYFVCD